MAVTEPSTFCESSRKPARVWPKCPIGATARLNSSMSVCTGYREVHFKPYRIIYEIVGRKVFIHCVLDGRRAVQELLERRLLRP